MIETLRMPTIVAVFIAALVVCPTDGKTETCGAFDWLAEPLPATSAALSSRFAGPAAEPGQTSGAAAIAEAWRRAESLKEDSPDRAALLADILGPMTPHVAADARALAARWYARAGDELARKRLPREGPLAVDVALIARDPDRRVELLARVGEETHPSPEVTAEVCRLAATVAEGIQVDDFDTAAVRAVHSARATCVLFVRPRFDAVLARLAKARRDLRGVVKPTAAERLVAGRRLVADVRNDDALVELGPIVKIGRKTGLTDAEQCEAHLHYALTLRRKRRRKEAPPHRIAALTTCERSLTSPRPASSGLVARARYQGAMSLLGADKKRARQALSSIVVDTPKSRYADDALYHLRKLALADGDTKQAAELEDRLLRDYPDGDLTRGMVWEPIEALLINRKWSQARPLLDEAAKLGPDPTYYGQGRTSYYRAMVAMELGDEETAIAGFRATFEANPTAFYGHLSYQRLLAIDAEVASWRTSLPRPTVAEAVVFRLDGIARGWARLKLWHRAASAAPTTNVRDKWSRAWLHHLAEQFTASHNIPRRRIRGFPERCGLPTGRTRLLFEIAYPDPYQELVEKWAETNDTDPFVVRAIMREESGFNASVISWAGAVGLMQLMLPTAKGNAEDVDVPVNVKNLQRPEVNLPIATNLLGRLRKRYDGHPVLMAAAYNAGPGALGKWLKRRGGWRTGLFTEAMNYREARNYSRRVVGSLLIYQWLYAPADREPPLAEWALTVER